MYPSYALFALTLYTVGIVEQRMSGEIQNDVSLRRATASFKRKRIADTGYQAMYPSTSTRVDCINTIAGTLQPIRGHGTIGGLHRVEHQSGSRRGC